MKINYTCNFCNKSLPSACFYHKHLMLKHNMILSKEDFYDLYVRKSPNEGKCLTCGKQTDFYKISGKTYTYKLYCDDSCIGKNKNIIKKIKNTKKERYGNENFNNANKAKETCIKKYGKTSFTKTDEYIEKTKKTCNARYGKDYYLQTDEIKIKTKETCQEKYNCDNYRQTQEYKDSYKNTCLKKYGKESSNQVEDIKQKKIKTNLEKTGYKWPLLNPDILNKIDETNIKRYGTKDVNFGSEYCINKSKETCKIRYGVEYPLQCKEIQDKCKRKYLYDGIFFDSSYELVYYIWLKDNNIDFTYHPNKIEYLIENETHYYFPDFKVYNELVELKGQHLINDDGILIDPKTKKLLKEKTKCLKDNNVKIIIDCNEYIEYVISKYGLDFITSCKCEK